MSASDTVSWISALATLGAVFVALGIPLVQYLSKKASLPKISIEYGEQEPFTRYSTIMIAPGIEGTSNNRGFWIRLLVRNIGKSVAHQCEGRLIRIIDIESMMARTDFDPVSLHWAGHEGSTIDINRGAFEYLDLVYAREDVAKFIFVYANEKEPRGIRLDLEKGKNYLFEVVVNGVDIEPLQKRYLVKSLYSLNLFPNLKVSEVATNNTQFTQEELKFSD